MKKNLVRKILPVYYTTWIAPAGVKEVVVTVLDKFDDLIGSVDTGGYAIKSNRSLWAWGGGTSGQLGDGTIVSKSSPVPVLGGHSFVQVFGGSDNAIALKADGSAWCWGIGTSGQLGDNTAISKSSPVPVVGGHSFIATTAGFSCSFGLKVDGSAWSWGTGNLLGGGVTRSSPATVGGGHSFIKLSSSSSTALALKTNGEAWAWGTGTSGQLGDGTIVSNFSPVRVIGGHSFVSISSGSSSYALKSDGSVWAWGQNSNGQLGDGTNVPKSSPVQVIGGHSFIKIAGSRTNGVLALKSDGSTWAWGENTSGSLGDGTIIRKSSPVQVIGGHSFISINSTGGVSGGTSYALKADGTVWAWGSNSSGALGNNTLVTSTSTPVQVVAQLFEAGVQYANRRTFSVTPGTTYNLNGFLTNIGTQTMLSTAQNNCYIVLEYYA